MSAWTPAETAEDPGWDGCAARTAVPPTSPVKAAASNNDLLERFIVDLLILIIHAAMPAEYNDRRSPLLRFQRLVAFEK